MLTRNRPTIVRSAANKYAPGSGNAYDHANNPYSQSGGTTPKNSAPTPPPAGGGIPKKVKPAKPDVTNQESSQMDSNDSDRQAKEGYLHAIAGLTPQRDDTMYRIGYDDGVSVLADHHLGQHESLDWRPQGTSGIISASSLVGTAYVGPQGGRWTWWIDGNPSLVGVRSSVEAAVASAEMTLSSLMNNLHVGQIIDDIYLSNPNVDPRQAVKIAKKAVAVAVED